MELFLGSTVLFFANNQLRSCISKNEKHCELQIQTSANRGYLVDRVFDIVSNHPYKFSPFCKYDWHGQFQTSAQFFVRNMNRLLRHSTKWRIKYEREHLLLPDLATVGLDWCHTGSYGQSEVEVPIVVIAHGLLGDSQSEYLIFTASKLVERGFRVCVVVARGCGNLDLTSKGKFLWFVTDDFKFALDHLKSRFPRSKLFGLGFSLGAGESYIMNVNNDSHCISIEGMLLKHLGESGKNSQLVIGICVHSLIFSHSLIHLSMAL